MPKFYICINKLIEAVETVGQHFWDAYKLVMHTADIALLLGAQNETCKRF